VAVAGTLFAVPRVTFAAAGGLPVLVIQVVRDLGADWLRGELRGFVLFGRVQGPVDGGAGNPEGADEFVDGLPAGTQGADLAGLDGGESGWSAGVAAAQACGCSGGGGAFVDEFAFVLGEGGEDAGEHPPGGGRVVDALTQGAQQHLVFGEPFDGANHGGQGAAEAIQSDNRDRVACAHVVQQRDKPGPVVAGPGELVGEDPCAPGGGQRVVLGFQGLVVGGDPRVPDDRHAVSVAELGILTGFDAPGFGPSSATTPPGRLLFALVSVGVVAPPWN